MARIVTKLYFGLALTCWAAWAQSVDYAKLPLSFEQRQDRYVARGNRYAVSLKDGGALLRAWNRAVAPCTKPPCALDPPMD